MTIDRSPGSHLPSVAVPEMMRRPLRWHIGKGSFAAIAAVIVLIGYGSLWYSLSPFALIKNAFHLIAVPVLAAIYHDDISYVESAVSQYRIGAPAVSSESAEQSWRRVIASVPGLKLIEGMGKNREIPFVPFVYERSDAPYLKEFRNKYRLEELIGHDLNEYDAMIKLARWVGTRWDHGTDEVPGGTQVCNPSAVVRAGEAGARFWCEIAARTMVHAAVAVGWQARVVTASTDGYTWEHAVAELWSNQFRKWFVIDTDYNVLFQHGGVPLSAFELAREGKHLQALGQLDVVAFAAIKPSLVPRDLVPFFAYVHVDMRNDWCSRPLRRGSPAGGDMATWWVSRDDLGAILTARTYVEDSERFDWRTNMVAIRAKDARRLSVDKIEMSIEFEGYGPTARFIEFKINDGDWSRASGMPVRLLLTPGRHKIAARLAMDSGGKGADSSVMIGFDP